MGPEQRMESRQVQSLGKVLVPGWGQWWRGDDFRVECRTELRAMRCGEEGFRPSPTSHPARRGGGTCLRNARRPASHVFEDP